MQWLEREGEDQAALSITGFFRSIAQWSTLIRKCPFKTHIPFNFLNGVGNGLSGFGQPFQMGHKGDAKLVRLTLAFPDNGTQKVIDTEAPALLQTLYQKRLGQDLNGAEIGDQFQGYLFRIGGGFDRQGFPMKQGVITPRRVRLLLKAGSSCYRPRCDGERKRKSVRGCMISQEICALHLIVLEKGPQEIPGLTDVSVPRRYGPKRASKLRRIFNVTDTKADLAPYVLKREVKAGRFTAPKVQRLITPKRLGRKAALLKERTARKERSQKRAAAYTALIDAKKK
jgi:small subunit ribosomal protein S6e